MSLLLVMLLSFSVFAREAQLSTVVPGEHEITVVYNEGGIVLMDGELVPSGSVIEIGRFGDIRLDIIADSDAHLKKVYVNGEDKTDDMLYGQLTLENVNTDIEVIFDFESCDGSDTPEGEPTHEDPCVRMAMSGNVFRGDKLLPGGRLEFDLGSNSAEIKNGKYSLSEIKDGYHQVIIYDDNGTVIGGDGFSIAVSNSVSKMKIERLPNGTQLITVPVGTKEINVDFIVNDDMSVTIKETPEEEESIIDTIIPNTSAFLRENPMIPTGIAVATVFMFIIIPLFRRKRKDEEEEA